MATLQELIAQAGLADAPPAGQTKTASEATKPAATSEVDRVLANLGLADAGTVKTASESTQSTGGSMGLKSVYEEIFGQVEAPTEGQTKEAAAATAEAANEETTATSGFGELVGEYFNAAVEPFFQKVSGELESEAGKGESPVAHQDGASSLGKTLGKEGDPHMPVNHSASSGAHLKVTTHNQSPYSLKEKALAKAILSRGQAVPGGEIKE
jgi:hypothetical protein